MKKNVKKAWEVQATMCLQVKATDKNDHSVTPEVKSSVQTS
jgi:hypothetical protein